MRIRWPGPLPRFVLVLASGTETAWTNRSKNTACSSAVQHYISDTSRQSPYLAAGWLRSYSSVTPSLPVPNGAAGAPLRQSEAWVLAGGDDPRCHSGGGIHSIHGLNPDSRFDGTYGRLP